jgi:hypothetical protein
MWFHSLHPPWFLGGKGLQNPGGFPAPKLIRHAVARLCQQFNQWTTSHVVWWWSHSFIVLHIYLYIYIYIYYKHIINVCIYICNCIYIYICSHSNFGIFQLETEVWKADDALVPPLERGLANRTIETSEKHQTWIKFKVDFGSLIHFFERFWYCKSPNFMIRKDGTAMVPWS